MLIETNLSGARLCKTNLSHSDLSTANLTGAIYDASTRWPYGFDPVQHGAVRVGRTSGP
jgi:hypothetical protein